MSKLEQMADFFADLAAFFEAAKVLSILIGIALFLLRIFAAWTLYKIAEEKGYARARFFWLPFLLGAVGALTVVALTDLRTVPQAGMPPQYAPVPIPQPPTAYAPVPPVQSPVPQPPVQPQSPAPVVQPQKTAPVRTAKEGHFFCPTCGTEQKSNREVCFICGTRFRRETPAHMEQDLYNEW